MSTADASPDRGVVPCAPTLRSHYERRGTDEPMATLDWFGTFRIELDTGDVAFAPGSRLALWCTMLLEPGPESNARVVERLAGHVVLEPVDHGPIATDGRWVIDGLRSRFPARHANDGPEAAFIVLPDGSTRPVDVEPATTTDPATATPTPTDGEVGVRLVPHPASVTITAPAERAVVLRHDASSSEHVAVWASVAALAQRLDVPAFAAADDLAASAVSVRTEIDGALDTACYAIRVDGQRAAVTGGDEAGLRHGLVTLAQWAAALPQRADVADGPAMRARIVHLDVARRWYEPHVVARLIDLAAWRKLERVHLHLTDDEAWRFPVVGHPALADVGGTRGYGLPIGPLVASSAEPTGRAYTRVEISHWVEQARDLGVTLVPEVDVPGHCHAALTAVPELRDPDDTSQAASVQGYVDNALVPGHPMTMPFLEAVFSSLAELFPHSPTLHIGGDEVPDGAWSGSPLAQAYAAARGLHGKREIETAFHRELIDMIRTTTGRDVAMWEEAALAGLEPSGYAVAWTSAAAGARLLAAGHDVVMSPGQAYYLDMAPDRAWDTPGATWAGTATLETTCDFDPLADRDVVHDAGRGVEEDRPGDVIGVQACIWGEHVSSLDVLDRLVFPRLDAVAERGWSGQVVGGASSLAARAADLPRFGSRG